MKAEECAYRFLPMRIDTMYGLCVTGWRHWCCSALKVSKCSSNASHDMLGLYLKSTMCVIAWVEPGAAIESAGLLKSCSDGTCGNCVGLWGAVSLRCVFNGTLRGTGEAGEMSVVRFLRRGS